MSKGAELQPTWCWGGRKGGVEAFLPSQCSGLKGPGGAAAHPQERGCNFQMPSGSACQPWLLPQRDGFQSSGVTSSGLGRVGRKEGSLMDTKMRSLALCSAGGGGGGARLWRGYADGETVQGMDF